MGKEILQYLVEKSVVKRFLEGQDVDGKTTLKRF
jgi:hypothetical protein